MNVLEAAGRIIASRTIARTARLLPPGTTVFLAGGSLRDRLLGRRCKDLDLVVMGDPRHVAAGIARELSARAFPLGRPPEMTWRVASRSLTVDVSPVEGGIERDVRRRDFTVNALFWRLPRGPLLDLVGGLDDLAAGRIRTIDAVNLQHDPLRVLRALRLLSTHPELALTSECGQQLSDAAPGLRRTARERVVEELRRLLGGAAPRRALLVGTGLGVLAALDPAWGQSRPARAAADLAGAIRGGGDDPRGWLRAASHALAPVALAGPSAGFPSTWRTAGAVSGLVAFGWPTRAAHRLASAALLGRALRRELPRGSPEGRELAARAGQDLDLVLAFACASARRTGEDVRTNASDLRRWARRFAARPPLVDGAEIAALLALPPGALRAEAVLGLRLACARGEVRSRADAFGWLKRSYPR